MTSGCVRSDGREIELNISAAPLRDREGQLVGAVCVLHDMTERNRLEREREAARADELAAREASRRMEAFLATAAHDLRSPLTAVIGYLDLAEPSFDQLAVGGARGVPRPRPPRRGQCTTELEEAGKSAERLTRLLTLLFDTAAARADQLELHRAPCDLAALVREQVAALRVAAPDRTIALQAPAGRRTGRPVEADADRIGQVVTNYLTNALKYSPPDRPVDVSVGARRGPGARGGARPRGRASRKAERARVWELFHRAPGVAAQAGRPAAAGGQPGAGALHLQGDRRGARRAGGGRERGRGGLHLLVHPPFAEFATWPGRRRALQHPLSLEWMGISLP